MNQNNYYVPNMKYQPAPEIMTPMKPNDVRSSQYLPSLKWIMEKSKDEKVDQSRLPPISNSLVPENKNGLQVQGYQSQTAPVHEMTHHNNLNPESPVDLHHCLFSKNNSYRPNNLVFPNNAWNTMNSLGGPIYVAVRPMNVNPMMQQSGMGYYNGDNKLILKATQSQQIIQIPIHHAALSGFPQNPQTYQIPLNQFTQTHFARSQYGNGQYFNGQYSNSQYR